jgi:hypothetical protein
MKGASLFCFAGYLVGLLFPTSPWPEDASPARIVEVRFVYFRSPSRSILSDNDLTTLFCSSCPEIFAWECSVAL